MLHKNVIEKKCGFRELTDAELEFVSGGVVSFTDGTAQTHNNKHLDDGFDAILGDPSDTVFLGSIDGEQSNSVGGGLWLGEGGSHGGENYQGHIVVTPQEVQRFEINGQDAYAILNHLDGTFVEYEVLRYNAFGFPIEFYPVGTGTFVADRTEVFSIGYGPISLPVTDVTYVLTRDPD